MLRKAGIFSFTLFLSLVILYQYLNRPLYLTEKTEKYIADVALNDSITIITHLLDEKAVDFSLLPDDSPFSITISEENIPVWWNKSSLKFYNQRNEVTWAKNFTAGQYRVNMQLQVFDRSGMLNTHLAEKAGIADCVQLSTAESDLTLKIGAKKYPVKMLCAGTHKVISGLALGFLLVLYFIIHFTAIGEFRRKISLEFNSKALIYYLLTLLVTRMVFLLPWITDLFKSLAIAAPWKEQIYFFGSHLDLLLNLVFFISFAILTDFPAIRQKLQTLPIVTYCIGLGFLLNSAFNAFSLLCRHYVYSTPTYADSGNFTEAGGLNIFGLICLTGMLFVIFHFSQNLFEILRNISRKTTGDYIWIGAGLLLSSLIWIIGFQDYYQWIITVFTAAYILIMDAYAESNTRKVTYLLWWLILFSAFLTANLYYFGILKDAEERTVFVNNFYRKPDTSIVSVLNTFKDSLIQGPVLQKFTSLEYPQKPDESEVRQLLKPYLKPNDGNEVIDFTVELFDKNGSSLFANHFANYHKTRQSIRTAEQISEFIFFNPFEEKYLLKFELENEQHPNSPFQLYIECNSSNSVAQNIQPHTSGNFDYVVMYKNEPLITHFTQNQRPDLNTLTKIFENTATAGFSFFVAAPGADVKIITFRKLYGLIKPISLFSFILTISGFLIILVTLINTHYDFLPENLSMKFGARSSLKTKIQSAIILLILATFLIIGLITAFYFKNLFEANNMDRQREESGSIIRNIQSSFLNMADEESAIRYLQSKMKEISFIHNRDMSVYGPNGILISTSDKSAYLQKIPFNAISNPTSATIYAFKYLYNDGQNIYDINPLYFNQSAPFAYLAVKYPVRDNTSGSIFEFLSTILNVYIFLFLLAGAIAITISNSITQPLTILADKLRQFRLGKKHDPLEWKSNDEIGELINDYNNLTVELHRSADMLARTERDMAWREMAKQVAHEIKNPLTPMKLIIQYLEKAIQSNPDKATELIPRVSATLVEQIDNLTQIANEFSNFATMPQASNEKIILNDIVETIHDLFRKRDDMDISLIEPIDELVVFADKNHLVRILNNLVKNAIQAIPDSRRGKIEIELSQSDNNALIRVTDNGTGIPDHMKDKVFAPNFTTKSSGTGLGLAISANMIESFNGKIYFETRYGEGTDFYISIPLMRQDLRQDNIERVSLD